jgi:hypothetical protein
VVLNTSLANLKVGGFQVLTNLSDLSDSSGTITYWHVVIQEDYPVRLDKPIAFDAKVNPLLKEVNRLFTVESIIIR